MLFVAVQIRVSRCLCPITVFQSFCGQSKNIWFSRHLKSWRETIFIQMQKEHYGFVTNCLRCILNREGLSQVTIVEEIFAASQISEFQSWFLVMYTRSCFFLLPGVNFEDTEGSTREKDEIIQHKKYVQHFFVRSPIRCDPERKVHATACLNRQEFKRANQLTTINYSSEGRGLCYSNHCSAWIMMPLFVWCAF